MFCGGKCPQPPPLPPPPCPTLKFWHQALRGSYTDIKFSRNKVVSVKTLLFVIGRFYNLHSICLNLGFLTVQFCMEILRFQL